MKKRLNKIFGVTMAAAFVLNAAGSAVNVLADEVKIVNIGVTNSLGGMNPLMIDQTEINVYAMGLQFLPLVELNSELEFEYMLADSVTTEDNQNFVVHLDENAMWSDGTPVTAEDVEYTFLKLASPVINNTTMMYYAFAGVGEDGFVEAGAESAEGVQVLDEKTIQFTSKEPMSLTTFMNTYARYLRTLPKHVLENYSDEELMTLDWFNHPDVVSGPYMVTDFDMNHYISYTSNENYWKGEPNIEKLNIKIMDGSQIYAGLQSGEIDITHHTMTAIPQEDYESIEALENVTAVYGTPVTNQSVFVQTANLQDERVRQALVYAIDREMILNQLLKGHGEIVDGFLSSASPFFDETMENISYDPDKAKELLSEAGWDGSKTLKFYVNSGDSTFVMAAQVMAAQWATVGVKAEIQTVDLATLMTVAGSNDYDLLAVQYTYAPVDPYPDITWLLSGEGSWTGYSSEEINEAMTNTQLTSDVEEIKGYYSTVNRIVQEEVPMFSAYVISAQGAVSERLSGAEPTVYGFFNDVQDWDIVEG